MGKRKQENHPINFAKKIQRAETIANPSVSPVVRHALRVGIAVAKGVVPITAVQRRELCSDRELRRKAGWFGQGS
jgi:hypothetical protein